MIDRANTLFGIFSDFFSAFSNIIDVMNSENCGWGIKIQAIITFIGILLASVMFVMLTIAVSGLTMAIIGFLGGYFMSKTQELLGEYWRDFCR